MRHSESSNCLLLLVRNDFTPCCVDVVGLAVQMLELEFKTNECLYKSYFLFQEEVSTFSCE